MRTVQWERMFPDELEAAFQASPIVYFPYGLCEPHGPHNALGLDTLKAHAVCCRAAARFGGIVAPPDYWHIHENSGYAVWAEQNIGEVRPWLTAVPPWIHFKNVCYHVRAADALGFRGALFVTGHYGPNWQDLKTLLAILQPHFAMRLYGLPDFEANMPGFSEAGERGDHAGKVETSLLWALEPDCVDVSRLPAPGAPGPHFAMGPSAHQAERRVGERMASDEAAYLGVKARELLDDYARHAPQERAPVSFTQVERIWSEEVEPILSQFLSMQPLFEGQTMPPSENSRWRLNWQTLG
ncbi:MAG: creatininase family protein [Armatimonadetes bacterium]|nr:creatininase family protein [Armatimonadota bacterium]